MRITIAILLAMLLVGCEVKYRPGRMVETKVDHRKGMVVSCSPGGFYGVRFSVNEFGYYYDFELEAGK